MKIGPFAVNAVLFDLDGTLLDTIGDLSDAANLMLESLGQPPRSQAEIHSFVGKGIADLVQRCLYDGRDCYDGLLDQAIGLFRQHYLAVNGRTTTIYPGVAEALDALQARGLPLAVVTNKSEAFTLPLLERMGLAGYFSAVVSGDTLPVKKPDPAVLHHACSLIGVPAGEALMIGDSANDALAARSAGMPVLLVSYGYSEGQPVDTIECDGLVSTLAPLPDWLVAA